METLIETVIIALFFGIVFVLKWNIASRIARRLNKDVFEVKWMTAIRCLPCFCFWISIPISLVSYYIGIPNIITAITATFIVAFIIDKI